MSIGNQEDFDTQAKQITGLLDAHAKRLSMRTLKQLENGRARAVKAHAQQLSGASVNRDGTLSSISTWAEHHRIASTSLIFAAMVASYIVVQSLNKESSDAYLLSADLPPEAFVDRGFEPALNGRPSNL
jgi:hypothetical protein